MNLPASRVDFYWTWIPLCGISTNECLLTHWNGNQLTYSSPKKWLACESELSIWYSSVDLKLILVIDFICNCLFNFLFYVHQKCGFNVKQCGFCFIFFCLIKKYCKTEVRVSLRDDHFLIISIQVCFVTNIVRCWFALALYCTKDQDLFSVICLRIHYI